MIYNVFRKLRKEVKTMKKRFSNSKDTESNFTKPR
jgi:hypothetical protein